jgi:para-aminobenzoate synthetase/4-amino-4-deoxychorismate lyase
LEPSPRGIYTGAIGFASPHGPAVFNVAIRTLVMKDGVATLGVGGGIVADSAPEDEYKECLLKASFLTRQRHDFQLIETMLWQKDFFLLSMHLDRMESSAAYFNFAFDREYVASQLQKLVPSFHVDRRYKIRMLLDLKGGLNVESTELSAESWSGKVKISSHRTSSTNVFFRNKTTHRELYNTEYSKAQASGLDEVLFLNELDQLTEGATTNLFIEKDGRLFTPPLLCGVLPGIFRRHLLETLPTAEEKILTITDLRNADAIFLCNSVRGMLWVNSLHFDPMSGEYFSADA